MTFSSWDQIGVLEKNHHFFYLLQCVNLVTKILQLRCHGCRGTEMVKCRLLV